MSLLWVNWFRFSLVILNIRMPENCKSYYFALFSTLVIESMEMRSYLPPLFYYFAFSFALVIEHMWMRSYLPPPPFFRCRKKGKGGLTPHCQTPTTIWGEGNSSFLFCISCLLNVLSAKRLLPTCKLILTIGIIVISYSIVLCCVMLCCVVLYRLVLY